LLTVDVNESGIRLSPIHLPRKNDGRFGQQGSYMLLQYPPFR
jgi:hypothetical protein